MPRKRYRHWRGVMQRETWKQSDRCEMHRIEALEWSRDAARGSETAWRYASHVGIECLGCTRRQNHSTTCNAVPHGLTGKIEFNIVHRTTSKAACAASHRVAFKTTVGFAEIARPFVRTMSYTRQQSLCSQAKGSEAVGYAPGHQWRSAGLGASRC